MVERGRPALTLRDIIIIAILIGLGQWVQLPGALVRGIWYETRNAR